MKRSNKALLQDLLQSIEYIKQDTAGFDLDMFRDARTVRDAVYRNFEIIGKLLNN